MDQQLAPAELLRFLQAEAVTLQQIQIKISNELHLLQGTIRAGMELLGVLHRELASAVPLMSTLPPDSAPATMPSVHLVSSSPSDPAVPKALHEITEWNQPVTRTRK